jgi:hypothetical protein
MCRAVDLKVKWWADQIRTWIFPLHAVRVNETGAVCGFTDSESVGFLYCAIRVEVVPSPSWVCDDYV